DMRRKTQLSGSKPGEGALNHPYRRQERSTDLMNSEIDEGRRIIPTPVVGSSSSSSGDFRYTDSGSMDLPVSDTIGEESNILCSATHQQVLGDGDGFDVERKRPYDAA
ncbi:unnamed protein product, partial [Allacma fusca]